MSQATGLSQFRLLAGRLNDFDFATVQQETVYEPLEKLLSEVTDDEKLFLQLNRCV